MELFLENFIPERSREKNVTDYNYKNCSSNGVNIAYRDYGQGEPLILIMGLGASSLKWEPHIEAYKKHFRCIAVDNRGSGRSDKPVMSAYTIKSMALDVIRVMDAEGIESAHLNGISMGGAIALFIAIHYPERVRSLVLTNTFPRCNVSFRRIVEILRESCDQLDGQTFGRLGQWIIYSSAFQETNEAFLIDAELNDPDSVNPMPPYAYKAQCNAILEFDESANLKKIKAPAFVVAGDSDLFVPLWLSKEMAEAIPNCQLFVAPNGGHTQHWENLARYNSITLDFLLSHSENRS